MGEPRDVRWHDHLTADERARALGWRGATIWFTGLSGSGKSTIAAAVERRLVSSGRPAYLLDGDNLRLGLNADLGFSAKDRTENIRRVSEVARLFADAGVVALVPVISPYRAGRDAARALHADRDLPFVEVWVSTPLSVCEARDTKGLYARARAGELRGMTGIDDPYEPPANADVVVDTSTVSVEAATEQVLRSLSE